MKMKDVLAEELRIVSPSREEVLKLKKIANGFIVLLKGAGLEARVGGSLAKGTVVRKALLSENASLKNGSALRIKNASLKREGGVGGKQDVDIFVVFDYSEDVGKLGGILKKAKLPGKLKTVHGSRDYFQIDCGDIILEVVPVVKNKDPELAENVTDVSLRHVKYVAGEIGRNAGLGDEIRLAKAFCHANRLYGAESYIRGFSGYALEVLVIYYGSFVKFLKSVGKKRVVDPMKYFRGEREVLGELNASKIGGPLVVVDPTYKYRNVTAGLGEETFEKFVGIARAFLRSPSLDFFELKEIDVERMKKAKGRFVEVALSTDRQEGDIAGTKMRKLLDFFVRELERKGQKVLRKEFDYSGIGKKAKGYLVVEEVPEIEVRGPSTGLSEAVEKFKKARWGRGSRFEVRGSVFEREGFLWYKKKSGVDEVFELVKKVMGEMGAVGKIV